MEQTNSNNSDDDDELATNQIKLKAQVSFI